MPNIEKLQSGLLYKEDFSEDNVMWQFFPNESSRYTKMDNSLIFNYCTGRSIAVTTMPDENFVMQCKVTHRPLSTKSLAGVLLLKDNDNWVECQLYKDENALTQHFYNYIKVVKIGYNFYFYASMDSVTWIVVGSMSYTDCTLIGFYFETDDVADSFIVEKVCFYKSPVMSVNANLNGNVVQLKNSGGFVIATSKVSSGKAQFDLTGYDLPLVNHTVSLLSFGLTIQSNPMTIYGGDVLGVKYNISLKYNDVEVSPNELIDMGRIYSDTETRLTLENLDDNYNIHNLKVSIEQYSPYDYACNNVDLIPAIHDDTVTYSKEVTIPVLESHAPIDILMKINKETDIPTLFKTKGFRYKIVIE